MEKFRGIIFGYTRCKIENTKGNTDIRTHFTNFDTYVYSYQKNQIIPQCLLQWTVGDLNDGK
jgi:hypothetical protein